MHPSNESPIEAGFLGPVVELLGYSESEEIQYLAASSIRNLASSGRNEQLILEAGAVQKMKQIIFACTSEGTDGDNCSDCRP
jgi:vacuolar protein 8